MVFVYTCISSSGWLAIAFAINEAFPLSHYSCSCKICALAVIVVVEKKCDNLRLSFANYNCIVDIL